MRFVFIQAHAGIYCVRTMCRVLEVSKAGYYAWRARPLSARGRSDAALTERIRALHIGYRETYGSPRVLRELQGLGVPCGKHRVARLMRAAHIRARNIPAFRITTHSGHRLPIAPNLLARQFATDQIGAPDRVWGADITYVPTREGWLYLAIVLDLGTRRVVGWAVRARLDQELAVAALQMALEHRGTGVALHHSDRGAQYACAAYRRMLSEAGCRPSMSRVGNCWDNAVLESFFASLTKELLTDHVFASRAAARRALFEFIEIWYNRQRRHSTLGYCSPVEYEASLKAS